MQTLRKLKSNEIKKIISKLEDQYGIKKLKLRYSFYKNNKDRIFIISTEYEKIPQKELRVNNLGLYFANESDNSIRLTIEGSQIIGPQATKNIIEINNEEVIEWMRGEDLNKTIKDTNFLIIKNGNDYFGSGRKSKDIIGNFLPKSRRVKSYKEPKIYE